MGQNCDFAWKEGFLRKLTNAAIVYQLYLIMLQSLKKSLAYGRSWGIRCCSFGPNWTKITYLSLKRPFFLKNWLMLILSTSCTPPKYYNVQKTVIKVDHKIQGWIIFGQIGLGYLLGENWLLLLLSICCAPRYYKV